MEPIILSTAVALGIGLLIGTERERSNAQGAHREIGGVRTFALTALLGVFAAMAANPLILAVFALLIGGLCIAGYLRTQPDDPGIATEVALLATFALGALCLEHPAYSAGAAVAVTLLLFSRPWLHELVKRRVSDRELHDALLLAAAALVVLPILPDRTVDPWEVLNPHRIWVIVVLVMTINLLGYIGLHLWGAVRGLLLAGLLGGLVSSIMTHAAMGDRCRNEPALINSAAAAAVFSSVTTAVFLMVIIATVDVPLALSLSTAFAVAAIANVIVGMTLLARATPATHLSLPQQRPVNLRSALLFGTLISTVLIGATLLSRFLGPRAALATTAAMGFADTHSGAISAAMLARKGVLTFEASQVAILLSFTANSMTKLIVSAIAGGPRYAARIAVSVITSIVLVWTTWVLQRGGL